MQAKLTFAQLFALLLLLAVIGVLVILAFCVVPEKNMTLFAALAGSGVGAGLMAYVNWEWGASKKDGPPPPTGQ